MLTVLLGLGGALSYGAADFFGGMAAKRVSPILVTGGVAFVGLLGLLIASVFVASPPDPEALFWGALSGITGALAIGLLYACLAIGPMSILSPTTALLSAVVPLSWGLSRGEGVSPWLYPAIGLALVAVVLVGLVPDQTALRPSLLGLSLAVASGILIGLFYVFIDLSPDDSGLTPLIANRAVQSALVFVVLLGMWVWARKSPHRGSLFPPPGGRRALLLLMVAGGLLDVLANVLVLTGLRVGDITVVSVLTALYPAGTILLAWVWLRERIHRVQWVGLILALGASALLAQ